MRLKVNEALADASLHEVVPPEVIVYCCKVNIFLFCFDNICHLKHTTTEEVFFDEVLEDGICIILIHPIAEVVNSGFKTSYASRVGTSSDMGGTFVWLATARADVLDGWIYF